MPARLAISRPKVAVVAQSGAPKWVSATTAAAAAPAQAIDAARCLNTPERHSR